MISAFAADWQRSEKMLQRAERSITFHNEAVKREAMFEHLSALSAIRAGLGFMGCLVIALTLTIL